MKEIMLNTLYKKKDFLNASLSISNNENAKIDCTGISFLSQKKINWLFYYVPKKRNLVVEISEFIILDTVSNNLKQCFLEYVDKLNEPSGINKFVKELNKLSKHRKLIYVVSILSVSIICVAIGYRSNDINAVKIEKTATETRNKYKLDSKSLTIGVLEEAERYQPLVKYLQSKLDDSVEIIIDGYDFMPYQLAINSIQLGHWDIAFTLSPIISIAAEDSNYQSIARMFPYLAPYYQSVMFTRKDSNIQSLDDIKPSTVIALGNDDSASSFYTPVYYLYGMKLTIDDGHRGGKIKERVRNGNADIGAGALDALISEEDLKNDLKIISQSMNIPGAGVYVSPTLSESDREIVAMLLNNAPNEVKNKEHANYGDPKTNIDYSGFREVVKSVEKIITCADFTVNPVNLYCNSNQGYSEIEGKVQDWQLKSNGYVITVIDRDKQKHKICLERQLATKIIGEENLFLIKNKKVKIKYISQQYNKCLRINNPLQIKMFLR